MRKWIIAGSILLALCVALIVAVLNINSYIERNREYLIAQAETALGRRISVDAIEVSIRGGIGARFENFRMADDPAFSKDDFVRARSLQANVRLWPLLRRDIQVKRLILNQPAINVLRNKQGVYNFSTIGPPDKKKEKIIPEEKEPEVRQPTAFLISLLNVDGGVVRYRDLADGTDLEITQLDLDVRDLDFNRPFSISLAAAVFAPKQNVRLKTLVGAISPGSDYRNVSFDSQIVIDPLDLKRLKSAVPTILAALPKEVDLGGIYRAPDLRIKGTLRNLVVDGSIDGTEGTIVYGTYFQKAAGIPLVLATDAQYSGDRIAFRRLTAKVHTLPLQAKGEVVLGSTPALNLSLNSEPASLDGWENLVPAMRGYGLHGKVELLANLRGPLGQGSIPQIQGRLSLHDSGAKVPQLPRPIANLNGQVHFTGQRAELKESTFNLGASRVDLAATIEKFAPLAVSYRLSAPQLSAADIQAELPEQRKNDVLRNVSSEGQLTTVKGDMTARAKLLSTDGILYNLAYKNLDTVFSYANNVAGLQDLRVNVLNGSARLTGDYTTDAVARFSMGSELKAIDLMALYRYFDAEAQRDIRGNLNGKLKIAGSGNQWPQIKPSLRGQGQAEVLEGALLNFNIADAVLTGATGIPGLANLISPAIRNKYPETFAAKDTEFKELQTQLEIGDARLKFKDLRMVAAQLRIDGNGWADFERRVDVRGVVRFSPQLSADIAGAVREIRLLFNKNNELEIPFVLSGELPNVRPRPDTAYLTKALQRGLLQRGAEEFQQLFGPRDRKAPADQIPEEKRELRRESPEELIRKGLEGLFGRQRDKK